MYTSDTHIFVSVTQALFYYIFHLNSSIIIIIMVDPEGDVDGGLKFYA